MLFFRCHAARPAAARDNRPWAMAATGRIENIGVAPRSIRPGIIGAPESSASHLCGQHGAIAAPAYRRNCPLTPEA